MGKIKKFTSINIRKISGGKDPIRIVDEFILQLGFDPDACLKENDADNKRWMIDLGSGEELEVLLEGLKRPQETTVYMGVNILTVPLRSAYQLVIAALEIADGLVGIKVSLVGNFLVLSASLGAAGMSVDELEYHYRLILAQRDWFRDALTDEIQGLIPPDPS